MRRTAFDGATEKGRLARREGKPRSACPYPDWRTARGSVTFARAFRRAWMYGWEQEDKQDAGETK